MPTTEITDEANTTKESTRQSDKRQSLKRELASVQSKLEKAEAKLRSIGNIYNMEEPIDKKGSKSMTHMGYNLQAAVYSLKQTGSVDAPTIRTLERVGSQIAAIATILGPDLIWGTDENKKGGK